jgi:hypothetical protein
MSNEFLKGMKKSQTDEVKQTSSYPKLSMYNDGNLYYVEDGKKTNCGAVVDAVLVSMSPKAPFVNNRAYWEKGWDPNSSQKMGPPICASPTGIKPYQYSPAPQAETCEACPWSKPGSAPNSETAQKCRSSKMAFFVFTQSPQMAPFVYHVPVTALKSLSAYVKAAQDHKFKFDDGSEAVLPMAVYRCQISRDPDVTGSAIPKFTFTGVPMISEADCVYTTELALKLDEEEKGLLAIDAPQQSAPAQIEAPNTAPLVGNTTVIETEVVTGQPPAQPPAQPRSGSDAQVNRITQPPTETSYQVMTRLIQNAPIAELNTMFTLQENLDIWNQCSQEEQGALTSLFNARQHISAAPAQTATAEPVAPSPTKDVEGLFQTISSKEQLPKLEELISKCDKATIKGFHSAFMRTAEKLTGVVWNPAIHGTVSKLPGMRAYPSFVQAGDYKNKRGAATAPPVGHPVNNQPAAGLFVGFPVNQAPTGPPVRPPVNNQPAAGPPVGPPVGAAGNNQDALKRVLGGMQNLTP